MLKLRRTHRNNPALTLQYALSLLAAASTLPAWSSPVDMLTYQIDPGNNGVNRYETTLTPANVNPANFGKIFTVPVDGQVFGQPLLTTNVRSNIGSARGIHDVLYVATEHDSLYAIDAYSGEVLWQDSFIDPENGVTSVPAHEVEADRNIYPQIGITGTPVIDKKSNTLYVSVETKEVIDSKTHYIDRLHAIDIETGDERHNSPATIADTEIDGGQTTYVSGPTVAGNGDGSIDGHVTFNAMHANQRAGLALSKGILYVAFSSHDDIGPYHGWLLGFRASDLTLISAFNVTPNGGLGGIWGAGAKPAIDQNGAIYFSTGNGSFDPQLDSAGRPSDSDYGNAILRLTVDPTTTALKQGPNGWGIRVADYFVPWDFQHQNDRDGDIGSGGICLLPDSMGGPDHQHLLFTGGKDSRLYLLDRDNMTGFHSDQDQVIKEITGQTKRLFTCPTPFDGNIYIATEYSPMQAYSVTGAVISPAPVNATTRKFGWPGATAAISANGGRNGILWALDRAKNALVAYDQSEFPTELYNSNDAPEDAIGSVVRFTVPTVVNGHVYAGTNNSVVCYGLLKTVRQPQPATAPTLSTAQVVAPAVIPPLTPTNANGVVKPGEVDLTWTNNATNATNYIILRKTGESGAYITLAVLPSTATSYVDTSNIQSATNYEYHILAVNSAGNADFAGFFAHVP